MDLPVDVVSFVGSRFPAADRAEAIDLLSGAPVEGWGQSPARLLRCVAFASRGSLVSLRHYICLLAIDWRDVIVAGEYDLQSKEPVRARDLNQPLEV